MRTVNNGITRETSDKGKILDNNSNRSQYVQYAACYAERLQSPVVTKVLNRGNERYSVALYKQREYYTVEY